MKTSAYPLCKLPVLVCCCLLVLGCQPEQVSQAPMTAGLRINTVLGEADDPGFARAERPRPFSFPADHGSHENYRSEWWYLTAVLQAADGREFGLQYTLFKQALVANADLSDPWRNGRAFLAHLALTDVEQQMHLHDQRFSRGHPGIAGVEIDEQFAAWIEDWRIDGSVSPILDLQLQAEAQEFAVDVRVQQTQDIVLQGDQGLSHKGPNAASYYYSMPRMTLSGQVIVKGEPVEVSGLAWLDREWSTSVLPAGVLGWDWFALQLDDMRSLMAFRLRHADGKPDAFQHGVQVSRGGETTHLNASDYVLTVQDTWTDEHGRRWPIGWQLEVGEESFFINAMLDDQLMDMGLVYWEGIVAVTDANGARLGRGYMELTGYDQAHTKGGTHVR